MKSQANENARNQKGGDKEGFALSTSWNAFRFEEGNGIIDEIKALGFKNIELSFNLTLKIISDIKAAALKNRIKVVSLHNYCPIPHGLSRRIALPDCYSLASLEEEERNKAVEFTKKTIDNASQFENAAVVLHCGRVETEDKTRGLIDLFKAGKRGSKEFSDLRSFTIKDRQEKAKPHLSKALKSLQELNDFAVKKNVSIGIETRFYYREIPSLEELDTIFDKFKGSNLFYWHDTGHAELMEILGFCKHDDFLRTNGTRMLGMHIHGIKNCQDHLAPATGNFDFSLIQPYLNNRLIKVIEAHHPASAQDISNAKIYMESLEKND